jgi:hypothetical protein
VSANWRGAVSSKMPRLARPPQQPEQAIGLGAAGLRQLLHRPPSGCQLVGHAELGGHVDHLGHPGTAGQLEQLVGEAEGRGAEGAEAMGLAEAALIPCSAGTPACHTLGLAPAPFETLKTITSFCGRAGASPRPAEGLCSRRVSIFNVFHGFRA